jgi:hypothetical protein
MRSTSAGIERFFFSRHCSCGKRYSVTGLTGVYVGESRGLQTLCLPLLKTWVYHCRLYILVTEKFLNRANIVAILKSMGGKTMSKCTAADTLCNRTPYEVFCSHPSAPVALQI